ncbi:MAG: hypothetical protein HOJ48_01150 [Desulfobacula sp.]|jgi:hypothetical protein|nr:hypothetical protein [Desulfobacula sp.]MBT6337881.1 hypothetical protein [Desulfobacula sp.]
MIDFNNAPAQKTGGGTIPPKSVVLLKMTIREPSSNKAYEHHPLITMYSSGLLGLDCQFDVECGTFEGNKIWENLFLCPEFQTIQMTKGQKGICEGSFAKLRAIIEAARGIDPNDSAPASVNARNINDWVDFQGMRFPGMMGITKPKSGDVYLNNSLMRVITMEKEDYSVVMGGGEYISDLPLPAIPESSHTTGTSGAAKKGYQAPSNTGQQQQNFNPGGQQSQQQAGTGGGPAWAK